ncbi:MAG: class I SAM-dependent methyltransferase [Actinomycetota bacterium]
MTGVINSILNVLPKRENYLEVGIFKGATFQSVIAGTKWGVDIDPAFDITKLPRNTTVFVNSSDNFFAELSSDKMFDMIYIDADHTFAQAYRELVHSVNHLNNWGVVLLDDTVPFDKVAAISDESESKREAIRVHGSIKWSHQGDVWKLIMQVSEFHKDLVVRTVLGPSRPRTIMWRSHLFGTKMQLAPTDKLASLTYETAFASRIPNEFGVKELSEIIAEIQNRRLEG